MINNIQLTININEQILFNIRKVRKTTLFNLYNNILSDYIVMDEYNIESLFGFSKIDGYIWITINNYVSIPLSYKLSSDDKLILMCINIEVLTTYIYDIYDVLSKVDIKRIPKSFKELIVVISSIVDGLPNKNKKKLIPVILGIEKIVNKIELKNDIIESNSLVKQENLNSNNKENYILPDFENFIKAMVSTVSFNNSLNKVENKKCITETNVIDLLNNEPNSVETNKTKQDETNTTASLRQSIIIIEQIKPESNKMIFLGINDEHGIKNIDSVTLDNLKDTFENLEIECKEQESKKSDFKNVTSNVENFESNIDDIHPVTKTITGDIIINSTDLIDKKSSKKYERKIQFAKKEVIKKTKKPVINKDRFSSINVLLDKLIVQGREYTPKKQIDEIEIELIKKRDLSTVTHIIIGPEDEVLDVQHIEIGRSPKTIEELILMSKLPISKTDGLIEVAGFKNEGIYGWVFEVDNQSLMKPANEVEIFGGETVLWKYLDFSNSKLSEENLSLEYTKNAESDIKKKVNISKLKN